MSGLHRILDSAVIQLNLNHVATSRLHCLLDSDRHFTRLASTEADLAVTVANNSQRSEAENTATLDHFGHAVDLDQFFLEVPFLLLLFLIVESHNCLYPRNSVQIHEPRPPKP